MSQEEWTTGLCGCFSDCGSCCLTMFCPCITVGRIAEIVDKGQSSCCGSGCIYCLLTPIACGWLYACNFRSKLKSQFGMQPSTCADCCAHLCCHGLALCQEYRELRNRGYDPSLGWAGNSTRSIQGAPSVPRGMMR